MVSMDQYLNPPSTNIIDFKDSFPHLNAEEKRHFHACKLINETITVDRTLTKKATEERFQLYVRMLEAFDSAEQHTTPGDSFRVLRRERQDTSAARWQAVGPAYETVEQANGMASKCIPGRPTAKELKVAQIEEGMRYFELSVKDKRGVVIEVLVVRCGSVKRDSWGEDGGSAAGELE